MPQFLEIETPRTLVQVAEVKLFHTKAVAKWRGLVASAREKLAGVSTGIGFIGSPEWVVTGSLIRGALENALSSANAKVGMKMLGEAGELMAEIRERGFFVPVSDIFGIGLPNPDAWQATIDDINFMTLGEDFIQVRTTDQIEMMVRWSTVSSVRLA